MRIEWQARVGHVLQGRTFQCGCGVVDEYLYPTKTEWVCAVCWIDQDEEPMTCGNPMNLNLPHTGSKWSELCRGQCGGQIGVGDAVYRIESPAKTVGLWVCGSCAERHVNGTLTWPTSWPMGGRYGYRQGVGAGAGGAGQGAAAYQAGGPIPHPSNPVSGQGTGPREVARGLQLPEVPVTRVPLIGYRGWVAMDKLPILRSINQKGTWEPGKTMVATCNTAYHATPPPVQGCQCGLYARTNLWSVMEYLSKGVTGQADGMVALGIVAMWGMVLPGETGARAEKANMLALWFPPQEKVTRARRKGYGKEIAEVYGVPVVERMEELEELADEHRAMWEMEAAAAEVEASMRDPLLEEG